MQCTEPYVLVFGVSICDIFGFTNNNYCPCDSNPGRVKVSYGGVCRNIAENMGRVGVATKMISVVGDDDKGRGMMEHAKKTGVDMDHSLIVKGGATPTYLAILDEKGEMMAAVVDEGIIHEMTTEFMDSKAEHIRGAEYVILDADNAEIAEHLVTQYKGDTRFILDPVSTKRAATVKHLIPYFHTIKPNRLEAEVLCGFPINSLEDVREAGRYFIEQGVQNVFISLDAEGTYYHTGTEEGLICAKNVKVVNVTGAGDAFVAGVGYGYMKQLPTRDMVKYAIAMSTMTIACEETIYPGICEDKVRKCVEYLEWEDTIFK